MLIESFDHAKKHKIVGAEIVYELTYPVNVIKVIFGNRIINCYQDYYKINDGNNKYEYPYSE